MGLFEGPKSLFGLDDGQGEYYKAGQLDSKGQKRMNELLSAYTSGNVTNAGKSLSNGGSLADLLNGGTLSADERTALASSPIYADMVASDQVRNDPLTSGLFGKGGSQDRALAEEKDLASRGYSLQPEDHEAYGQASGNIARLFGAQEQGLSRALASRGLAAGGSGAAAVQYSGLQGNKNEQLAASQRQIADNRMNNTVNRLQQVRSHINNLGTLGQKSKDSTADRNILGAEKQGNLAGNLANNEVDAFKAQEEANQASMTSKLQHKTQNIGDALSSGLYQGVEAGSGAAAAGMWNSKTNKKGVPPSNQAGGGSPATGMLFG